MVGLWSRLRRPEVIVGAGILLIVLWVALILSSNPARAQEHRHPPQDAQIHEQFYLTWKQKMNSVASCCNKKDCYPTAAKFDYETGLWKARRREDGKWLWVPRTVYDQSDKNEPRSPDGRSHLCARLPGAESSYPPDGVICFRPGEGST